jgi:hypothetical protein
MVRQPRTILVGLAVERAVRVRRCGHSRAHTITAGEICLAVTNSAGAKKSYCRDCGGRMIDAASASLADARTALRPERI